MTRDVDNNITNLQYGLRFVTRDVGNNITNIQYAGELRLFLRLHAIKQAGHVCNTN